MKVMMASISAVFIMVAGGIGAIPLEVFNHPIAQVLQKFLSGFYQ